MDLASLFSALQATQQAKSTVRLSERNVIELVNKLKQLGVIGDDLLHTINGKEYLTTARLKQEVLLALQQAGGRLSIVELPALLGVDLVHCERQAAALVAESHGDVLEAQGELMTAQYFTSISAEINDLLQELGQLSVADLALQYQLATELLLKTISQNLGTVIQGRLEAGLLYTPAALRRIKAQLRGALRGVAQPAAIPTICKDLGLEGFGASTSTLAALVEELLASQELSGTVRGGGTGWVPSSYAAAQQGALTAFYEQNSWVGYDMARKLGFASEKQHLSKVFPDGIALDSCFVHPTLLARVQSAVEETLAAGGWVDVAPLLPSALNATDIAALLQRVPQLSRPAGGAGGKAGAAQGAGAEAAAQVLSGTCVVSGPLVAGLREQVTATARTAAAKALAEKRAGPGAQGKAGATQAGKGAGAAKVASKAEEEDEDWSTGPAKKGKGGKGGGKAGGKAAGKGGKTEQGAGGTATADSIPGLSVSDLADQVLTLQPEMEGAGEGEGLAEALAKELWASAVSAWEATLQAAFTAGAESRRQAKDTLAKALEDAFTRLCLYSAGADLFAPLLGAEAPTAGDLAAAPGGPAKGSKGGKGGKNASTAVGASDGASAPAAAAVDGDDGTYSLLEKHILKLTGTECVDLIFKWVRVDVQAAQESTTGVSTDAAQASASAAGIAAAPPLTAAERAVVMRASPPDVVSALQKTLEVAGAPSTKAAIGILEEAAQELGLRLRRLDKKSERPAISGVKAQLLNSLTLEQDPAAALTQVIPLLFIKTTGKAIILPGKAISAVLGRIAKDMSPEHTALVDDYHAKVVEYLKAVSNQERANALLEELNTRLPAIKALVGLE